MGCASSKESVVKEDPLNTSRHKHTEMATAKTNSVKLNYQPRNQIDFDEDETPDDGKTKE